MKIGNIQTTALPQKPMKTGYVLYARKSSESEDKQAASIEDQLSVLTRLSHERNLDIRKEFTESMSAKSPNRPVFNEMLEYITKNTIKGIVCWKLNRLFRNPKDEGTIRWLLQNNDIEEIVTPAKIYLEVDSDFLMAVEGAQASRFIKDLRADTLRGIEKKIDNGNAPIVAPAGYRNDTSKPQGMRTIEPDSVHFPIMRQIFDLALTGTYTIKRLFDIALDLGLKNSRGNPLSHTRFYLYISNPIFYTGRYVYGGIVHQGAHKRMITDAEYDLLTDMYKVRVTPRTEDVTRAYNGLLVCSCGRSMTGERHKKHYKNGTDQTFIYYRCSHCRNATSSYISLKSLEAQITAYLSGCSLKQHYVDLYIEWLNEKNNQQKELRDARLIQLERVKTEVIEKIDNLVELYISPFNKDRSLLDDEEFKKRKTKLLIEKQKAIDDVTGLDKQMEQWTELIAKTFQFATKAVEKFTYGTIEDKRAIVRAFGSNLTVDGKQLDIMLRTPFELIQRYVAQDTLIEPMTRSYLTIQTPSSYPIQSRWGDVRESDPLKLPPQGSA